MGVAGYRSEESRIRGIVELEESADEKVGPGGKVVYRVGGPGCIHRALICKICSFEELTGTGACERDGLNFEIRVSRLGFITGLVSPVLRTAGTDAVPVMSLRYLPLIHAPK